jgi:TonB family protein
MVHDSSTAPNVWRLGFRAGEPFNIVVHRRDESWTLSGTAKPHSEDTFDLDCQFKHGDAVVGRPHLLLRAGVPAGVKLGTETSTGFKGFGAQITLQRGVDPASAGYLDENGVPKAASVDPKLHATYRSMRRIAYPAAQLAGRIEGVVYVRVHVSADGDATDVTAVTFDPPGASVFANAAVDGVKQWRFNALMKAGRPTASDEIIPIVFSLHSDTMAAVSGGTLDAIRISPPDESADVSGDHPPSEDTSFRIMYPPKYPAEAVRNKQSGSVRFKVLVDESGMPQSVDLESSDPPGAERLFAQASIDAIMHWRFNPGITDGKPSAGYILVPIKFSLDDE